MFLVHLPVAFLVALFLSLLLISLRGPRSAQAKASTAVGVLFLRRRLALMLAVVAHGASFSSCRPMSG